MTLRTACREAGGEAPVQLASVGRTCRLSPRLSFNLGFKSELMLNWWGEREMEREGPV